MIAKVTVTLNYGDHGIDFVKTCELPAFPPPDLPIVDWTKGDEVTVHDSTDAPLELLYVMSENTLYVSSDRHFTEEKHMFGQLSQFIRSLWEIDDSRAYDNFVKEHPDFTKFLKNY